MKRYDLESGWRTVLEDRCCGCVPILRERITDLERRLALLCERAVIDFDDEAVGLAGVTPPGTYGDYLREVEGQARRIAKLGVAVDQIIDRYEGPKHGPGWDMYVIACRARDALTAEPEETPDV